MPTDENILGFSNRWYKQAIATSTYYTLKNELEIRVITAPYFLATKLEAFKTRGNMDLYASHDFEDIISVLDGRFEIVEEIKNSENELKEYLVKSFKEIKESSAFKGSIPGQFSQYGSLAEDRIELLEQKINLILSN